MRIFKTLIFLIGLSFMAHSGKGIVEAYKTYLWPKAPGIILKSESSGNKERDTPGIRYRYSVSGKTIENDQILLSGEIRGLEETQKILKKYPVNKEVLIHFDPVNPSRSVLEPGLPLKNLYEALTGFFMALYAFVASRFRFMVKRMIAGFVMINSGVALLLAQIPLLLSQDQSFFSLHSLTFNGSGFLMTLAGYWLCKPGVSYFLNWIKSLLGWKGRENRI